MHRKETLEMSRFCRDDVTMSNFKIAVVEDDRNLCKAIKSVISNASVKFFFDLPDVDTFLREGFDLTLVDEALPSGSGFEFVCHLKKNNDSCKIVFITANSSKELILNCLNIGVNQFLEKPFHLSQLNSVLAAALNRKELIKLGEELFLNTDKKIVEFNGKVIDLTPIEYKLVEFLVFNKGIAVEKTRVIENVWGKKYMDDNAFDVHLSNLRKKANCIGVRIKNVRGRGYFWE